MLNYIYIMAKLIHKKKVILNEMKYLTSMLSISKGLMLSSKKKCKNGVCLVMPTDKDVKFGASVTMMFCLYSLEIIFVNSKFKVVDKVILKPWKITYVPKSECRYVIESYPGNLKEIKIGDTIKIEK